MRKLCFFLLILPVIFMTGSCGIKKHIPQDQLLLKKIKINNSPEEYVNDLEDLSKIQPNRRILGFYPFYLWIWYKFNSKKLGEPPAYIDTSVVGESYRQMEQFLLNQGYLDAEVNFKLENIRNKKANLIYEVDPGEPYYILSTTYFIPDRELDSLLTIDTVNRVIERGVIYKSEKLIQERERITRYLKNLGYYGFSREHVYFQVVKKEGHRLNVGLGIRNPEDTRRHLKYRIGKVYIEPNYQITELTEVDTNLIKGYYFIGNEEIIKPSNLLNLISLKPGQMYSYRDVRQTISRLSELEYFKFIDVGFEKPDTTDSGIVHINGRIRLTPKQKRELSLDMQLTTTEGENQYIGLENFSRYYGIAPTITYKNKNLFKRGLQWTMKLRGAYEVPDTLFENFNNIELRRLTNIYEIGGNMTLSYPSTFLPKLLFKQPIGKTSRTALSLSYLLEGNPDFNRTTGSFTYTYQFNNDYIKHFFSPIDLNLVRTVNMSPSFLDALQKLNPFLRSIFDTYLISGGKYTLLYNDKTLDRKKYWFVKWNVFEIAGNTLWLYKRYLSGEVPNDSLAYEYQIRDIGFYQYFKTDVDIRYYILSTDPRSLVVRFAPGIGYPYGNTDKSLPFERSFFVGGSNSIRAWPLRGLGPGSFRSKEDDLLPFQVGDIKLEANIEYRFDLFYILEGAIFTDIGNIWTFPQKGILPTTAADAYRRQFKKEFISEIAIGSGVGLRLDFTFFIFRLDFAWKIHDPTLPKGERWTTKDFGPSWFFNNDINRVNIGIGYPF